MSHSAKQTEPLVSIDCITYNQSPYIRQCLDGMLMQQTTFKFEILVHDDASTDGTADIIKEYEEKYPDIIRPIYQTENQWSKKIGSISAKFNYPRARGKYIALCEGDDYWTDPLKLQKQVDFLEAHPEYSVCCSNVYRLTEKTGEMKCRYYKNREITLNEIMYERSRIPTLSAVMRTDLTMEYLEHNEKMPHWPMGDLPMWLWMSSKGNIYKHPDITGVYRILEESTSHTKDKSKTFFFRLSSYEIRLYFCNMLNKCSFPIWAGREFFIIKHVLRNFKTQRDKLKYMLKPAWPIK